MLSILNLLDNPITIFMAGLTAALFVTFSFKEIYAVAQYRGYLKELTTAAKALKEGDLEIAGLKSSTQAWITSNLIVEIKGEVMSAERDNGLLLSRLPPLQLMPAYDAQRNKLIPALLTSLGILGTFLGITVGLSQISMTGESTVLLASAQELLDGMKTAFTTSLIGLGLSAIFMILLKQSASRVTTYQSRFLAASNKLFVVPSAIALLRQIAEQGGSKSQATQVQLVSTLHSISKTLETTETTLGGLSSAINSEVISASVAGAVTTAIESQLSPILREVKTELELLKDIKADTGKEVVELLIGELRDHVVKPIAEQVSASTAAVTMSVAATEKLSRDVAEVAQSSISEIKNNLIEPVTLELARTASAVQASNEVTEVLNKNVASVVETTAETSKTIAKFQEETLIKLQDFAMQLKGILGSFKEETSGAMTNIVRQIDDLLTRSDEVFDQQRKQLEGVGTSAAEIMTTAKIELERGLGDIDSKVLSMSNTVQQELEAFRTEYQSKLTAYFSDQNQLLDDSLEKQKSGLNSVVDNFRDVFETEYKQRHNLLQELTLQYDALQKSAQVVERVVKAVGVNDAAKMAELQAAADSISSGVAKLNKEYVVAAKSFQSMAENIPPAIASYFEQANDGIEKFFKDFDREASNIHNRLAQAASYLITAEVQKQELNETGGNS